MCADRADRDSGPPRRPLLPGSSLFASQPAADDPAVTSEIAHRTAALLVRRDRASTDPAVAERIRRLSLDHDLEDLASLWSTSSPDSLPGSLWRLYLLGAWVHRHAGEASREYSAGCRLAEVQAVIAGVADPPGPTEVLTMIDEVLSGIAGGDYAVVLDRAAAFARIVASGRAELGEDDHAHVRTAARMMELADQLSSAARVERHTGLA